MLQESEEIRMILLGHTGAGKSSTGNSILGRTAFESDVGKLSRTQQCTLQEGNFNGRALKVIDTPGFFDTERSEREVSKALDECLELTKPGPHAFLFVISLRNRFPKEAEESIKRIERKFGKDVYRYSVVVFTGRDELNESIDSFIRQKITNSVRDLLDKCDQRYVAFNNSVNRFSDDSQVQDLVDRIDTMGGRLHGVIVFTGQDELDESLDSFLQDKITDSVRDLLSKCGNRKVAFDNYGDLEKKRSQLQDLIQQISNINGIYINHSVRERIGFALSKGLTRVQRKCRKRLILQILAVLIFVVILYYIYNTSAGFHETLENDHADVSDLTEKQLRLNSTAQAINNNSTEIKKELRKKML